MVDASHDFSNIHAKFWGVGIYEDDVKWLLTQPEGQLMDVDGSEVGPGCFTLDLEIPIVSNVWVRKDYLRIYDECQKYCDRPRVKRIRAVALYDSFGRLARLRMQNWRSALVTPFKLATIFKNMHHLI